MTKSRYPSYEVYANPRSEADNRLLVTVVITDSGALPCASIFSKPKYPCDLTLGKGNYITQFLVSEVEEIDAILNSMERQIVDFIENPANTNEKVKSVRRTISAAEEVPQA